MGTATRNLSYTRRELTLSGTGYLHTSLKASKARPNTVHGNTDRTNLREVAAPLAQSSECAGCASMYTKHIRASDWEQALLKRSTTARRD